MPTRINLAKPEEKFSYILVAQANLHKMPQATVEVVNYINTAMKWYRYDSENGKINNVRKVRHKRKQGDIRGGINLDGNIDISYNRGEGKEGKQ